MASLSRSPAAALSLLAIAGGLVACGSEPPGATTTPPSTGVVTTSPTAGSSEPSVAPTASDEPVELPDELDFTAETIDGATFDGPSLAGQDAVVYFWAPWCPVCRREAPGLVDVVAGYPDLTFVTVAGSSQDRAAMAGFVSDVGFDEFANVADESGEVWTRFGVTYQYTYAFVDDLGTVELVTGPLDEADVRARIDALIAS